MTDSHLRKRAEAILQNSPEKLLDVDPSELHRLIHELSVHQIELEVQREELEDSIEQLHLLRMRSDKRREAYEELYNTPSVGFVVIDNDGVIIHSNSFAKQLLSAKNIISRNPHYFVDYLTDDSQQLWRTRFPAIQNRPEKKLIEIQLLTDTSELRFVEVKVTRLTNWDSLELMHVKGENKSLFQLTLVDVSEKKAVIADNTDLNNQLDAIKVALDEHASVSIADEKGRITYANDKFSKISQYSAQELLGQDHNILNSGTHSDDFFNGMWQTITSGNVWHGIIKNKAKDGSFYWVSSTIVPMLDEQSQPKSYISIRTDITPTKMLEEQLQHAVEEASIQSQIATRANKAKSEFLASMSHELRTPLNSILGFAQLMQEDPAAPLTPNQKESTTVIINSGRHLLELIGDILDLTQIESGSVELKPSQIEVHNLLDELGDLIQSQCVKAKINLLLPKSSHRIYVTADLLRLKQVLLNLLSNAIKYNREGGRVTVSLRIDDAQRCQIRIEDTGIGIPAEAQSQIFGAFNRLGQECSAIEGTGIGLVITKNLVELMNGEIGYESEQNMGSTFWVTLPLANDPTEQPNIDSSTAESPSDDYAPEVKHVLYVEDNLVNQKLMTAFFKRQPSLSLSLASSGKEALNLLAEQHVDMILMDINLPDGNGIALTDKIRHVEGYAQTPVIALSAAAMTHERKRGKGMFNDYLTKPVDFDVLMRVIHETI
jgi:PAS domain S-box-containing protein